MTRPVLNWVRFSLGAFAGALLFSLISADLAWHYLILACGISAGNWSGRFIP